MMSYSCDILAEKNIFSALPEATVFRLYLRVLYTATDNQDVSCLHAGNIEETKVVRL